MSHFFRKRDLLSRRRQRYYQLYDLNIRLKVVSAKDVLYATIFFLIMRRCIAIIIHFSYLFFLRDNNAKISQNNVTLESHCV